VETSKDLEALQLHYGGIPFTSVISIAVKRLALVELHQNQAASLGFTQKEAA
jgi:hypothetical protein